MTKMTAEGGRGEPRSSFQSEEQVYGKDLHDKKLDATSFTTPTGVGPKKEVQDMSAPLEEVRSLQKLKEMYPGLVLPVQKVSQEPAGGLAQDPKPLGGSASPLRCPAGDVPVAGKEESPAAPGGAQGMPGGSPATGVGGTGGEEP